MEATTKDTAGTQDLWMRFFPLIAGLVAIAAATGWFVEGFYSANEASIAVKFRVYDLVLLVFALPIGILLYLPARSGKVAPKVLLPGVFIYFAFSYGVNTFNCYQNQLFLVYVAILSLSVVGSAMGLVAQRDQSRRLTRKTLNRGIAAVMLLIAFSGYRFLLTDAVNTMIQGGVSPAIAGRNLPVNAPQVIDLGFTLPLTIFGAIRLWQLRPIGLAISAAMLMFYVLISASVATMEIGLQHSGYVTDPGTLYAFGTVFVLSLAMTTLITWVVGKEWPDSLS